jgi:hypothetical protein
MAHHGRLPVLASRISRRQPCRKKTLTGTYNSVKRNSVVRRVAQTHRHRSPKACLGNSNSVIIDLKMSDTTPGALMGQLQRVN